MRTLQELWEELSDLDDALTTAYEGIAEAQMSNFMELGRDFVYQRTSAHDFRDRLVRETKAVEAELEARFPHQGPPSPVVPVVVYDDDAPF